jgi:hypothetical protein
MHAGTRLILSASISSMLAAVSGCGGTKGQAVRPGPTGFLPTNSHGEAAQAQTLVADKIDMRSFKPLALVTANESTITQIRSIGYFTEVISLVELQRRVVEKNVQDKVPSISDRIGINNAARFYGKFLWIHYDTEKRDGKSYVKLVATDPTTLLDVFVAERELVNPMLTWNGYTDQNTWYPLFNSFIAWLKSN